MDDVSDEQSGPVSVAPAADTGLIALCLIARHLGVPANPAMLGRHHLMAGTVASKEDLTPHCTPPWAARATGKDALGSAGENAAAGDRPQHRRAVQYCRPCH